MKYKSEVTELRSLGDELEVTLSNVRGTHAATWRDYSPAVKLRVPFSCRKAYMVGRKVEITVQTK